MRRSASTWSSTVGTSSPAVPLGVAAAGAAASASPKVTVQLRPAAYAA
jgi:hypothetical protein